MSAPVDVLAVLDEESNAIDGEWGKGSGDDLREARAAVAELIEAVGQYRLSASTTNRDSVARLDAALARVKGGAA